MARGLAFRAAAAAIAVAAVAAACGGSSSSPSAATSPSTPATTGGTSSAPSTPTGATLNIGMIGTFSGFSSDSSKQGVAAATAWVDATNAAGGINGHPVKLSVVDDAGSETKAVAGAKTLVQQDHVIAIVGQHESGLEAGWEKYVDGAHIPVIGGIASAGLWLSDPNFFPTNLTPVNELTTTIYAGVLAGKKNYGIIYCAEVPGCAEGGTLAGGLTKSVGATYAGGVAVAEASTSYTPQCLQLKQKGADAIFTASSIDVAVRFIANCAQQGYKPTYIDDTQNWGPTQTANPVWQGAALESDGVSWVSQKPAMVAFRAAMAKYEPKAYVETSAASTTWAADELFGKVAQTIKTGATPTAADIYKGLYALPANYTLGGIIPPVTITKGKAAVQQACLWYMSVNNKTITTPKGSNAICVPKP